jgi:TnpA family transposase
VLGPVTTRPAEREGAGFGQFPEHIERDWLGRWCHLSEADLDLVNGRYGDAMRLGLAVQLATVRAIGTFLPEPTDVPDAMVKALARQLRIGDPGVLVAYAKSPAKWQHTAGIRERYGYVDYTDDQTQRRLQRWLFRMAWNDDLGPSVLVRSAHHKMLDERILLPSEQTIERLVATIRERASQSLWQRLATAAPSDLLARLERLLEVPSGKRRSELDRLRRSPFSPTVAGLVQGLDRLGEIRALDAGGVDLSRLPGRRVAGLARYAEDAWVSQLRDLAPQRRAATLVAFAHSLTRSAQDDVVDIFDIVFGDMQRAAKHRGEKLRDKDHRDYDRAVSEVHAALRTVLDALDDPTAIKDAIAVIRDDREQLDEALGTVTALMRSPSDPFHDRLIAAYPQIRKFLTRFLDALTFESIDTEAPVLDAFEFLRDWHQTRPRTTRLPDDEVPLNVVTTSWGPYVMDRDDTVNRAAYTCCVLDRLRAGLRRRDIYLSGSLRWGDPRAELLPPDTWEEQRIEACAALALDTDPSDVIARLSDTLDTTWQRVAANFETNNDFRIEERDGADRIVVAPLDAVDEPDSVTELRNLVEGLLPEVEVADVPLEVNGWVPFLGEYTHISGAPTRTTNLHESVAAMIVSDACNVGLTPVAVEDDPALTRDRLNWVAQNYIRTDTHSRASTLLFDYHAQQPLAAVWGGGDMASADGMRLVIPVSTIHAGYNPRYFGRQRGSTLYTWMADTHSSFHQTLIPGTQRDSLYTLDGLVANKTSIKPDTVSTDTAGASEIVFALCWTLGYRYAPRLKDLGDHRLWRTDPTADYRPLDGLARNRINSKLIAEEWDEICRLTASIEAGTVVPSTIMRTLQRGPNPSRLSRALVELGRIIKTLHILNYCDDATYRRDIQRILNRGESRNGLARDVFNGGLGKLAQRYQAGQESQLGALGVMVNIIVLWQTVYTQAALDHLAANGHPIDPADVARLSPLAHPTINLQGRYETTGPTPAGTLRPLRTDT